MEFKKCSEKLELLHNAILQRQYFGNTYEIVVEELNKTFIDLLNASIKEKKFFSASPLDIFITELERRITKCQTDEFDFDEIEYLKEGYLHLKRIISAERYWQQKNTYYYLSNLDDKNYSLFRSIIRKRITYVEKLLYKKGIEVIITYPNGDSSSVKIDFKKHINIMVENDSLHMKKNNDENTLNWNGTQTEFIEIVKALIENGNIKGTQTEIISKLSNVFNIKINNENKLINDIKTRNNGSETLFLDKLQKSLYDYITLEKRK